MQGRVTTGLARVPHGAANAQRGCCVEGTIVQQRFTNDATMVHTSKCAPSVQQEYKIGPANLQVYV